MKKKFEKPELIIIQFSNEDIIVTSGDHDPVNTNGEMSEDIIFNN